MHEELEARLWAARDHLPGPDPGATARAASGLRAGERQRRHRVPLRRLGFALATAGILGLVVVLAILLIAAPKDQTTPAAPHWRPGDVVVPDLRGRLLKDTSGLVRGTLLTRPAAARRVDGVTPGTVLDQNPPPGTSVARESYVRLTVAVPTGPGGGAREQMPDFTLQLVDPPQGQGREVSLASLRGKVVVLAFTASWCEPCVAETAALNYLLGYDLVAIATNDTVSDARSLKHEGQSFRLAADPSGDVTAKAGVASPPSTVILDRDGHIAARFNRSVRRDDHEIYPLLDALRAEQPVRVEPGKETPMGLSVEQTPPLDPALVPDALLADRFCEIDQTKVWRLATSAGGTSLYVARAPGNDFMIATLNGRGFGGTIGCGTGGPLGRGDIGFGIQAKERTITLAYAIVPDGYTEATVNGRRFPIEHNGLVLDGPYPEDTVVRFSGPAGTRDVPLVRSPSMLP